MRPRPLADAQRQFLAPVEGQPRRPFAVAPVEEQHRVAVLHAQHMDEIVELVAIGLDRPASDQRVVDMEPLHPEIRAHGLLPARAAGKTQEAAEG